MKKIIILFTVLVSSAMCVQAQQIPLFSELYFMRLLYNPALTGYNGSTNITGFYRNQWVNLPGHPVTAGAVAETSLWKDRSGVGFDVYSDNSSIINRFHADLYYAQKVRIAKDHLLSLGVTLGVAQTYIDFNNAVVNDVNDPHILQAGKAGYAFNMNIGLAYQWKTLTVGFSVPQVVNSYTPVSTQINYATYGMQRAYIGNVSYGLSFMDDKIHLEPMVQLKKESVGPFQVDISAMADYKKFAFFGLGYSLDYGLAIMAAVRIGKVVTLGYSYDVPIMGQVNFSQTKGSQEVIIGICFDKWTKKKSKEPVYAKKSDVDSVENKLQAEIDSLQLVSDSLGKSNTALQKSTNSLQQTTDSLQNQQQEQQEMMRQIKDHLDSFENITNEYKQTISKNTPMRNFPAKVTKETTAEAGDILRLSNVNFQHNSSYLLQESYVELNKVAEFLKNNRDMKIRINGHTDALASDTYNQWLSDRRAKRVYDYLLERNIPAERMSYFGFGKRVPIADNSTEEGRAKNRRVEIEILKKE